MEANDQIASCEEGCLECEADIKRYKEIIDELGAAYLYNSNDPATLCSASFREFNINFQKVSQAQGELFEIANRHNLSWTQ